MSKKAPKQGQFFRAQQEDGETGTAKRPGFRDPANTKSKASKKRKRTKKR